MPARLLTHSSLAAFVTHAEKMFNGACDGHSSDGTDEESGGLSEGLGASVGESGHFR